MEAFGFHECLHKLHDNELEESRWGYSSAGRAPALHAGGLQFDPA